MSKENNQEKKSDLNEDDKIKQLEKWANEEFTRQTDLFNLIKTLNKHKKGNKIPFPFPENVSIKIPKVQCEHCGYIIAKPYPKSFLCPNCEKFSACLYDFMSGNRNFDRHIIPRKFKIKMVKDIEGTEKIKIEKIEKRIKFYGIVTKKRKQVYYSEKRLDYILDLISNLDYIANSILLGSLDKMLIIDKDQNELNMYFFERENFIHVLSGNFSEKDANWLFNKLNFYFLDLMKKNNLNSENFSEKKKYLIYKDMERIMNQIETDVSLKIQFEKPKFDYLDQWMKSYYFGLSYLLVGVMSILFNSTDSLYFENIPDELTKKDDIVEFKESTLTAKIEAILSIIIGNTEGYPRWISVKTDFQKYKYLIFKKEKNKYFSYYISEGNLDYLDSMESNFRPFIENLTKTEFSGSLKKFNETKKQIIKSMKV